MARSKITVKVFALLLKDFDARLRALHIKRDAFLEHVISKELPYLEKDLEGKCLPPKVRQYIARKLKRMGTVQINLLIDKATAERLNEIVSRTNISRDAFINRIIFFLRASDNLLQHFGLPSTADDAMFAGLISPLPLGYLDAISLAHRDPLLLLRLAIKKRFEIGLNLLDLPEAFVAFACYLDESVVLAATNHIETLSQTQNELNDFTSLENSVFQTRNTL